VSGLGCGCGGGFGPTTPPHNVTTKNSTERRKPVCDFAFLFDTFFFHVTPSLSSLPPTTTIPPVHCVSLCDHNPFLIYNSLTHITTTPSTLIYTRLLIAIERRHLLSNAGTKFVEGRSTTSRLTPIPGSCRSKIVTRLEHEFPRPDLTVLHTTSNITNHNSNNNTVSDDNNKEQEDVQLPLPQHTLKSHKCRSFRG
jgi:hypothetical protein